MGVGPKIKELRNKAGLTQKDLADQLNVTYQAVSRWENEDAEPSIDTMKDMCRILNCSIEELFGMDQKEEVKDEFTTEENNVIQEQAPVVVEKVIVQEAKPVLCICGHCNKPIYEQEGIHRVSDKISVSHGRTSHIETREKILCDECYEAEMVRRTKEEERRQAAKRREFRKRRIHSFVWSSIASTILVIIGIVQFVNGNAKAGFALLGISILAFCFISVMILDNTFITDMWEEICSWGFIKLPGIIFDLSFDGIVFLIAMKILFFLIGISVALLAGGFATALAMALSIFVYPSSLKKNIKLVE